MFAVPVASPASADPGVSTGGSARGGYNAIPSKVSENVPSLGFEATQTKEFGDEVALSGKGSSVKSMSVLLSSWGCESGSWGTGGNCATTPGATFDVDLTFTIYEDAAGVAGDILVQGTETFAVAYRPSASPECAEGRWYNAQDRGCYNGFPQVVDMSFAGETLTDQVIWTIQYNTTTAGYSPIGSSPCVTEPGGCGYDSLNVGVWSYPNAPFAGTDIDEDEAFRNGVMEPDWSGYRPLGSITTK